MSRFFRNTPRVLITVMSVALIWLSASLVQEAYAQNQKKKEAAKEENFNRPAPTQPIKPTIPDVSRYQDDKVFLEQADSLFRPFDYNTANPEKQIVKGQVKFRQAGLWMFCDSAYYYPELNSLDAFGHVVMKQGDTIFVYADKLFYDGYQKKAILTDGPSQTPVKLQEKDRRGKVKMTLTTDSLDYDIQNEVGWYSTGGKLEDEVNTLTSVFGQYFTSTKEAEFRDDVVLVNHKDGYTMYTDVLLYNTATHVATIKSQTRIESANDTILTTAGWYNTDTDNAELTARSTIIHKDSAMNVTVLEGDSIIYDKSTSISRAYMFRDPDKHQQPMVLTDTARKMILIGGYGEYNDRTREAFATEYPLLMEFSRPDTLFLRADTILTEQRIVYEFPPDYRKPLSAEARARLEAFNSLQDIADSMDLTIKLLPDDLIEVSVKEDTISETQPGENGIDSVSVIIAGDSVEEQDSAAKPKLIDIVRDGKIEEEISDSLPPSEVTEVNDTTIDKTFVPLDSDAMTESVVKDSMPVINTGPRLDSLGRDSADMVPVEYHVAKAYRRARFFTQDMQGIADSMEYQQYDSMLYMLRRPIVWSEEKEVTGDRIDVHFNDSTVDWALLPETGMLAEYIDEDFYNQLSGKIIRAFFKDKKLSRLEVEGNVETIFLPMEEDSTYNRLVHAESSYMTMDMNGQEMERMKWWPEVSGTVSPIFMVKNSQKRLPGFTPHFNLRPEREWYGDRVRWADQLGEIPEDLERYFSNASNMVKRRKAVSPFERKQTPVVPKEVLENSESSESSETSETSETSESSETSETSTTQNTQQQTGGDDK